MNQKYKNTPFDTVFNKEDLVDGNKEGGNWRLEYEKDRYLSFVHTPKTAGISVWMWVQNNFPNCEYWKTNHLPLNEMQPLFSDIGGLGFTFAIVRNPYEWCVSRYAHYLTSRNKTLDDMDFLTYLELAHTKDGRLPEPKGKPKSHKINFKRYYEGVQLILRYEYLPEEFGLIQDLVGCHEPLPLENVSRLKVGKDYRDFYNDKSLEIVKREYGQFIEMYNYEW